MLLDAFFVGEFILLVLSVLLENLANNVDDSAGGCLALDDHFLDSLLGGFLGFLDLLLCLDGGLDQVVLCLCLFLLLLLSLVDLLDSLVLQSLLFMLLLLLFLELLYGLVHDLVLLRLELLDLLVSDGLALAVEGRVGDVS